VTSAAAEAFQSGFLLDQIHKIRTRTAARCAVVCVSGAHPSAPPFDMRFVICPDGRTAVVGISGLQKWKN
jgi:hypothetical protein